MELYHYYDRTIGPFRNLSDLPLEEAKAVLDRIRKEKPGSQSAGRDALYVEHRRVCEEILRKEFAKKGGRTAGAPLSGGGIQPLAEYLVRKRRFSQDSRGGI